MTAQIRNTLKCCNTKLEEIPESARVKTPLTQRGNCRLIKLRMTSAAIGCKTGLWGEIKSIWTWLPERDSISCDRITI